MLRVELVLVDTAVIVLIVVFEVRVDAVRMRFVAVDLHLVRGSVAAGSTGWVSTVTRPALTLRPAGSGQRAAGVRMNVCIAHALVAVDVHGLPVARVALW